MTNIHFDATISDDDRRELVYGGDIFVYSPMPAALGRTRYSIDFRAVNANDVATQHGAVKVDSDCTGSTMGDYLRCSDLSHLPRDLMLPYEMGPPPSQMSH